MHHCSRGVDGRGFRVGELRLVLTLGFLCIFVLPRPSIFLAVHLAEWQALRRGGKISLCTGCTTYQVLWRCGPIHPSFAWESPTVFDNEVYGVPRWADHFSQKAPISNILQSMFEIQIIQKTKQSTNPITQRHGGGVADWTLDSFLDISLVLADLMLHTVTRLKDIKMA